MQQTTIQSYSLQKALYTLLSVRASNLHTRAPPQTSLCPNKAEIWEMVLCGEAGWDKTLTPEYAGSPYTALCHGAQKSNSEHIYLLLKIL